MYSTTEPREEDSYAQATRRRVLQATAGALTVGAVSESGAAQQATGPTVYVGSRDDNLYAVDARTGERAWAFTEPSGSIDSSPTVADGTVFLGSGVNNQDGGALYAVDAVESNQI
jgi:outer membrane protein assembly factor BamB